MNERIKELAEQAGFYFYDMHDVDGQDLGESVEADTYAAAEQFADLIRNDERRTVIANIINLLNTMHESAKDSHNYWQVAAKLIETEFGDTHE